MCSLNYFIKFHFRANFDQFKFFLFASHDHSIVGLVLLGSENEGAYNLSHTISNMLVLGGYAEPQYRSKIQQILTVPRMHQGESTARFRKKMNLRRKVLTMAEQTRKEVMARAWDLSDNEVRNRWVRLAREALNRRQKLNPDAQHMKVT